MEGRWRGAAWAVTVVAGCALMVGASGCGGDESSAESPAAVKTANPEQTFAPLVELAPDEPWRPMSARWFIERSVLWFAEDRGCDDRKIAVGHTLPEQQNTTIDWIFPKGFGIGPAYYRSPYRTRCNMHLGLRIYADQLTRPHDRGARIEGVRPGQGFYLDLADEARGGPVARGGPTGTTVYAERSDEGDGGVRLTYWLLFGMHGRPGQPAAREGDWERIDVLLRDLGDDRYELVAVQLGADGGSASGEADDAVAGSDGSPRRDSPRSAMRVDGTHPVVRLAAATHAPTVARPGDRCGDCLPWETWRALSDAREEVWYGFGGAWGQPGATSATTGPLGPYRFFPSAEDKEREVFGRLVDED